MAKRENVGKNIIAPKGEVTYWSRAELARYLDIDPTSLNHFIKKGAPDKVEGKFDVYSFCEFLVKMPKGRRGQSKARTNALKFLKLTGSKVKVAKEKVTLVEKGKQRKVKKTNEVKVRNEAEKAVRDTISCNKVLGMTAALERAKNAEVNAHEVYQNTYKETGIIDVASLDAWQRTLEVLRKCETDFTKVMEKQKFLVERSAVQSFVETMVENTKTILLNLPSKMAPSLDGLPWQDIQERLTLEVRDIIDGLAKYE